jgi:hypothetical protein
LKDGNVEMEYGEKIRNVIETNEVKSIEVDIDSK